jgi:hypothetical protein
MKNKPTKQYVNRYKDLFTFTYDKKKNVILWEGDFKYCRYGWDTDINSKQNILSMVDPSGGPYISSGMQSNLVIDEVEGFYVDYLSANEDIKGKIKSFNIHLKPLNK